MSKKSAGVLAYRFRDGEMQVLLVHPGGPYWRKKDLGSWSIPKGEIHPEEEPFEAALREFREETACEITGSMTPLTPLKQPSGKVIHLWAVEGECDENAVKSMVFEMEWPPRSGKMRTFPEIEAAEWFTMAQARVKILKGQMGFLDELEKIVASGSRSKKGTTGLPNDSDVSS